MKRYLFITLCGLALAKAVHATQPELDDLQPEQIEQQLFEVVQQALKNGELSEERERTKENRRNLLMLLELKKSGALGSQEMQMVDECLKKETALFIKKVKENQQNPDKIRSMEGYIAQTFKEKLRLSEPAPVNKAAETDEEKAARLFPKKSA